MHWGLQREKRFEADRPLAKMWGRSGNHVRTNQSAIAKLKRWRLLHVATLIEAPALGSRQGPANILVPCVDRMA